MTLIQIIKWFEANNIPSSTEIEMATGSISEQVPIEEIYFDKARNVVVVW